MKKVETNLPFPKTLHAFWIQLFDSYHDSRTRFGWCQSFLMQPSFVNFPEASFSEQCIRFETLRSSFQLRETKLLQAPHSHTRTNNATAITVTVTTASDNSRLLRNFSLSFHAPQQVLTPRR